ncbi:hypothetical protein BKG77_07035 [Mycobacteroides chelonae]|uniref:STAS domain-containing protein n=1 Tax=Mycobacteroides chelonae TaxID=1774 RepID=UPI0008A8D8DD|nr:STAS domain-containing protein [Mycobacteroides chelonae]OHU23412.1 hypothetical protein BKG77_07035 [Mycobacteroides chelonae]
MPVRPVSRPCSSISLLPFTRTTARFTARWHRPSIIAIGVSGELDATNVECFVDYAIWHLDGHRALLLDLHELDFFGSEGFLALLKLKDYCQEHKVQWSMVPSQAVDRMLDIGDPAGHLPTTETVSSALREFTAQESVATG